MAKIIINESDLKSTIKTIINELDVKTYSNLMNKTSDFPWTTHFNTEPNKYENPKQKGNKERRVNTLSRGRFIEEFYKEFPKGSTKVITTNGIFSFEAIKFESNHTMYDLIFKSDDSTIGYIWFKKDNTPNGFFIDFGKHIDVTDQNSIDLINEMLKYNN